jgi:hypothetical protein
MAIAHEKKVQHYQEIIDICAILELQLSDIQILPHILRLNMMHSRKKQMWKSAKL